MADTITLRDHSKPCKHKGAQKAVDPHGLHLDWYTCSAPDCPGGREITLQKENCLQDLPGSERRHVNSYGPDAPPHERWVSEWMEVEET